VQGALELNCILTIWKTKWAACYCHLSRQVWVRKDYYLNIIRAMTLVEDRHSKLIFHEGHKKILMNWAFKKVKNCSNWQRAAVSFIPNSLKQSVPDRDLQTVLILLKKIVLFIKNSQYQTTTKVLLSNKC
jgi:hypothetical protein